MGLGFRLNRGVRLYAGNRGLGASVGSGRVRYYHFLGGGSRSGSRPASVARHRTQARAAERLQEVERVAELDLGLAELCEAHHEEFESAGRRTAPPPEPVDRRRLWRDLRSEATAGIPWWKLGRRREAQAAVAERFEDAVAAAEEVRSKEQHELQATLDEEWRLLGENDPETVLAALEAAFEQNEAPAAAVSCHDGRVDVVMRWPTVEEVVPERKAATTPTGKPTTHKRSKTERDTLYLQALASHALVTAKEALAVCPGIDEVGIAVVREALDPARGDRVLEPLVLAELARKRLEGVRWQKTISTAALLENASGRIGLRGKGARKALHALDLSGDEAEREFVGQVASDLGLRVPDDGVPGLGLPIKVEFG